MKSRRVHLSLEVETDVPLSCLRQPSVLGFWRRIRVIQSTPNVIRPEGFKPNLLVNAKSGFIEFVGIKTAKRDPLEDGMPNHVLRAGRRARKKA